MLNQGDTVTGAIARSDLAFTDARSGARTRGLIWRVSATLILYRDLPGATIRDGRENKNISTKYLQSLVGERCGRGGLGAPARWLQYGGADRLVRPCARGDKKAWGAERERSANTHAAQIQVGKLCMRAHNNITKMARGNRYSK
eukprot:1684542-Pleurochrysis_carterae.AAC.2